MNEKYISQITVSGDNGTYLIKDTNAVHSSDKGIAGGVASLDSNGLIPTEQLPSYVDDVVELLDMSATAPQACLAGQRYYNTSRKIIFIAKATNTWEDSAQYREDPKKGKIYVNVSNNTTYRWGGSDMISLPQGFVDDVTYSSGDICVQVGASSTVVVSASDIVTDGGGVKKVDGILPDSYAEVKRYLTCSTAGNSATKIVVCPSVTSSSPIEGTHIFVNFINANTAENPKLQVGSSEAKSIDIGSYTITTQPEYISTLDGICEFIYNYGAWNLINKDASLSEQDIEDIWDLAQPSSSN